MLIPLYCFNKTYPMRIAVCCAMNQNRSMEAHSILKKKGYNISSYGTNKTIKIPGPSAAEPNVYPFGTTYAEIYSDLLQKDPALYKSNGMLYIMERNMGIKERPENFFDAKGEEFTCVITCDKRCFWAIYEGTRLSCKAFWLVNFDIKDTPNDAIFGASDICMFLEMIVDSDVERAIEKYGENKKCEMLFCYVAGSGDLDNK